MKKKDLRAAQKDKTRTPIVTLLGHVDHGKTTLLDFIRKSRIQQKEAGGITQSTSASKITTREGKEITFIDTPGHAAFSEMRSRGAKIADVVVLVVAANDGSKPQTEEALKFIQETKTPFVVAITKMDLPSVSVEKVKAQLTKIGVKFEGEGGNTPAVLVSGKTGKGVDDLLEMITLLSEVNNISDDPKSGFVGYVIETNVGKSGPVVNLVVKNGSVKVGDQIYSNSADAKVRAIFDTSQKSVKGSQSGNAVGILGFKELPKVGSKVVSSKSELRSDLSEETENEKNEDAALSIVLKTKSNGTLEAIIQNLPEEVSVVGSGVGEVTESDVFLAKSTKEKLIFAFEAKVPNSVARLALTEGVAIEQFSIIYKLFERLEDLIKGDEEIILGEAEIVTTFPYNDVRVAGCKVVKGRVSVSDTLILMRGDEVLGKVKIKSMKKIKKDIQTAKEGEELGIIFTPQLDFSEGDVLISVRN